jgi:uncharacterized RDD family membrane protein YckC
VNVGSPVGSAAGIERAARVDRARAVQGTVAGFASRTLANVIDALATLAVVLSIYLLIGVVRFLLTRHFHFPAPSRVVNAEVFWGVAVTMMTVGWATTGKTLGKGLVGLRVTRIDRAPVRPWQALARAALYVLFLPGFLLVLFSRRGQSVQDHVVRTTVLYDWSNHGVGA